MKKKVTPDLVVLLPYEPEQPVDFVIVLAQQDNQWLLIRHQNLWEMPGGKVEACETPLQAAQRELLEETGYEADQLLPQTDYVVWGPEGHSQGRFFLALGLHKKGQPEQQTLELNFVSQFPLEQATYPLIQGALWNWFHHQR